MCRNKILILFVKFHREKYFFFLQRIIFLIITIIESFALLKIDIINTYNNFTYISVWILHGKKEYFKNSNLIFG